MNYLEKIKELRVVKGLSQYEMAEKLNISQSSYYQIESGKTEMTLKRFYEIAKVLEVPPGKLLLDDMTVTESHEYIEGLIKTIQEQEEFIKFLHGHLVFATTEFNFAIDELNKLESNPELKRMHLPTPPKLKPY